jgi:hypothetical protein
MDMKFFYTEAKTRIDANYRSNLGIHHTPALKRRHGSPTTKGEFLREKQGHTGRRNAKITLPKLTTLC